MTAHQEIQLQTQTQRQRQFWRFFGLFLLSFVLVLLVAEIGTRFVVAKARPSISAYKLLDHKFYLASRPASKVDTKTILLVGDSYMNMAVYPELLSNVLHQQGIDSRDIRNLGVPGNSPTLSLFLLKQAMKHTTPDLVVFSVSDAIFNGKQKWQAEERMHSHYFARCFYPENLDPLRQIECGIKKGSLFFRFQGFLKEQAVDLMNTVLQADKALKENPWGNKAHVYLETSPQGWSPGYRINRVVNKATDDDEDNLPDKADDFRFNATALTPLINYCKAHHLPLVLVWFPYQPGHMVDGKLTLPPTDRWVKTAEVQRLVNNNSRWFLDLRQTTHDPTHFYDSSHLNILGAIATTQALGQTLGRPPYRSLLGDKS